jgi:GNAT superfamily N-acetyltransferase
VSQPPRNPLLELLFGLFRALFEGILNAFGIAIQRAVKPIEVRRGTADEVIDVRHRVLREGRPRETAVFDGDTAKATRHWVAVQHDRIVGVVSVMQAALPEAVDADPRPTWQLRGMAVLPELQGAGVGRALLQAVHAEVDAPMWCNARAHVERFYGRQGWRTVSAPFEVEPIGPHVRMVWTP